MPNNWKTYKLSELYETASGLSKSRDQFGFGYPFLTFKDVFYNYFLPDSLGDLANTNDKERFRGSIKKGDIFLTRTSETLHELGMSSVSLKDYPNATFNGFCKRLRLKEGVSVEIDPLFMGYYLRSGLFRNEVTAHATMTTRASLNNTSIASLKVKLPELNEQKSIGKILKAIDDKIENNLAINKTLEDMAMALYKHWFVDFGPFQDSEFIESELGPIPKGWEVKQLGDLIEVISGYAFKSKWFQDFGEKVVKIKNISNNVVHINNCNCISAEKALEINDKFKIEPGDFLVAMTGAEVGKVGVVPHYQQPLWLNQRVGKLKDKMFPNSSILVGKILQSKEYYEVIQGLAYGSAQPNISASGIENIEICLPKNLEDIQVLIDEFVSSQNQIIHNLTENESLTKLRDTYLPRLISGEVRLKEFQNQIESVL